jgi:hypothetical protein
MNYNPYAAPQAAPPQLGQGGPTGMPQAWDAGEVLSAAFETFKNNAGLLIGVVFVFFCFLMPLGLLPSILTFSHSLEPGVTSYVIQFGCSLGNFVIDSFFTVGLMRIFLAVARGQQVAFGELFSGASHFVPMLAVIFLTRVIEILGCCSIGLLPIYMGLCFAGYFVVDQNLGPIEAFNAAWRATEGQRGNVLIYALLALVVYLAGALFCGIGALATGPIAMLGFTIIYLRITGGGAGGGGVAPAGPGYGPPPGGPFGGPGGPGFGGPGGPGGPGFGGPGGGYGGPSGGGYGPPAGGGGYGPPGGGGGYGPPGGGPGY